jgi:hypothetical protein
MSLKGISQKQARWDKIPTLSLPNNNKGLKVLLTQIKKTHSNASQRNVEMMGFVCCFICIKLDYPD